MTTPETQWLWWQNALAGIRGLTDPNTPQTGYYRVRRKGQDGFWPIAYWIDSKTNQLRCPATIKGVLKSVSEKLKPPSEPLPLPQPSPPSAPAAQNDESPKKSAPTLEAPARPLTGRSGFHEAPRAEEIAAIYQNKKIRGVLSNLWRERGGKQAWELIVAAHDGGLLVPNNLQAHEATISLLFPLMPSSFSRRYNLSNQKQRPHIRDVLLPAMIACRDKLLADPENIQTILFEYSKEQNGKQQQAVIAEKHAVAVKTLPVAEQPLMMFGHPVWPWIDNGQVGKYDYDQVRAAIWFFREYETANVMAKEDIQSLALRVRNSLRYLNEYMKRTDRNNPMAKIFSLVIWFSRLMEKNPTGECKWPMYPHIEGQW